MPENRALAAAGQDPRAARAAASPAPPPRLWTLGLAALVFDLDGVITRTASVHARAWKDLFDAYLAARAQREGTPFEPFDAEADYLRHVDGLPRYEGVRRFLESRGIALPWGHSDDPPEAETICGLGNRKNIAFARALAAHGVEVFDSSVRLVRAMHERGLATAINSSSRNARAVLERAGLLGLFDAVIDGSAVEVGGLRGKPAPDTFVRAAAAVGARPAQAAVFEDAVAGVAAGRAGGFGLVVGVDRGAGAPALREAGADIVVTDLGAFPLD